MADNQAHLATKLTPQICTLATFEASAIVLSKPGEDTAARTGLATMLTQLGQPGAAADELLNIQANGSAAAVAMVTEPLERLGDHRDGGCAPVRLDVQELVGRRARLAELCEHRRQARACCRVLARLGEHNCRRFECC